MATSSTPGDREYEYNDDDAIASDDHDILLPGLEAQPPIAPWREGGDWLLPGVVGRSDGCSSEEDDEEADDDVSSTSSNNAGRGETGRDGNADENNGGDGHRLEGYGSGEAAHTPTSADVHHQHEATWVLQIVAPGASAAVRAAVGESLFGRAEGAGGAGDGPAALRIHQLRLLPSTALRSSPFAPFGTSSLQHRDSFTAAQRHPLTLPAQHHQHPFPSSPSRQPHALMQLEPPQTQRNLRAEAAAAALSGGTGSTGPGGGVGADGRGGGSGRPDGAGGGGTGAAGPSSWSFLNPDIFAPNHRPLSSSSSSSSASFAASSRQASPTRQQPESGPYSAQAPPDGRARPAGGPPPWMGGQYASATQFERQFGVSPGLDRTLPRSSTGTPRGRERRGGPGPDGRVDTGRSGGMSMDQRFTRPGSPVSTDSFGSTGSPRGRSSSRGSWAGDEHDAGDSRFGDSLMSQDSGGGGGGQLPALWPTGRAGGGDHHPTGFATGMTHSTVGPPSRTGWRPAPGGMRPMPNPQPRLVSGRGPPFGPGWRPARLDTNQDAMAETSWDNHLGGGLSSSISASTSFGLSTSNSASMLAANRASILVGSPRSSQAGSLLARPSSSNMGMGAGGSGGAGSSLPPLVGHRGGGTAAPGTTRCFTSIDSPPGPYERRRMVLTSAQRRSQPSVDPATPTVRQYSEGLAGVLTNTQIQEWMSQHASRLLLPRHMHEIADIVFRPASAAPEKKPPKLHPGNGAAAVLPPPAILGGRYAPAHVSRILVDPAYVAALLGSLAGVEPANSRVVAVVTALQGKDVTVAEEGTEQGQGQQLLLLQSSLKRLPSKVTAAASAAAATALPQLGSARSTVGGP